ncbi:hypothetical protein AKJ09_09286 [Labilithrix luteola]|uniref:Uncharacterized protein n=1 Tax=Labilithrix luteola TaxID=1391654 RepID=A0A0K1QA63_9BACT|nr:hypothetical protein AKJ09_09286 [Labilithrix luteola]
MDDENARAVSLPASSCRRVVAKKERQRVQAGSCGAFT